MDSPTYPPLQRSDWTAGCRDTAEGIPAQIHITRAANSNESDTAKRCARVAKTHFSIGAIIINKTWLMPRKKKSFIVWSSSCSLLTEWTRSRKHKHPDKGWEQKRGHDAENQKAQTRTIYLSGNCQLSASVGDDPSSSSTDAAASSSFALRSAVLLSLPAKSPSLSFSHSLSTMHAGNVRGVAYSLPQSVL